jgi:hypothetical protein
MNPHLRRGLIASSIAFGMVAVYGAMDIFFYPPIDEPSVGYWGYWLTVKAVLAIGIGFGLTVFALVGGGSWLTVNIRKTWVKIALLLLIIAMSSFSYLVNHPYKSPPTIIIDKLPEGRLK